MLNDPPCWICVLHECLVLGPWRSTAKYAPAKLAAAFSSWSAVATCLRTRCSVILDLRAARMLRAGPGSQPPQKKKKADHGMQFHHVPLYASPGELWRRLKTVLLPLANPCETDCSCFESLSITVAALVLMPLAEHSEITCPGKTCCSLLELERRRNMLTRLMLSDPRFACCTNASCWARE